MNIEDKISGFGKNLKRLRKTKKLKMIYICACLDIRHKTYYDWESGKSQPRLSFILKLCELFEVTPNQLLGISYNRIVIDF